MKRIFYLSLVIIIILIFSTGIINGLTDLQSEIDNHLSVKIIGRWQSYEMAFYNIEFKPDSTFNEYYYDGIKRSGVFQVHDNSIELTYDETSCQGDIEIDCTVTKKYKFELNTLVLITNESKMTFDMVNDQ